MTPARRKIPRKGDWNLVEAVCGVPQSGKTVAALRRTADLAREFQVYRLACDPNGDLPDTLPDGTRTDVLRVSTFGQAAEALRARPSSMVTLPVHDATKVLQFASSLAPRMLRPGADGKMAGPAWLVYVDEVVLWEDVAAERLGTWMRQFLGTRRHLHTGLVFTTQSPRFCHRLMFGLSTRLQLFHIVDDEDLDRLRRGAVPSEVVKGLASLPQYASVVVDRTRFGRSGISAVPGGEK